MAVLLLGEAAGNAVWLFGRLPALGVHGAPVLAILAARGVVTLGQCAVAVLWLRRAAGGWVFVVGALLASAVLLTVELGFGQAPTSVFPAWRWPIVGAYWGYVLGLGAVLKFETGQTGQTGQSGPTGTGPAGSK
jgi:hypothetical protein